MDSHRDFKPRFIMWDERDFREDRAVHRMSPHQRAMYRNLLMECYYGEHRPYLTADDNELWIIAEADSLQDWITNKALILSKFRPVPNSSLLSNKRVLAEWDILIEKLEQKKNAGRASAEARRKRVSLDDKENGLTEVKKEGEHYTTPHHTNTLNSRSTDVQRPLEVEESATDLLLPKEQNQDDLLKRMAESYAAQENTFLNLAGKQRVLELSKVHGAKVVEQVWQYWLNKKDLEGLKYPLILFAEELPGALAAMQKDDDFSQIGRLNAEAAVIDWAKQLRAVAEQPSLNSCTRGSGSWEDALCEWAKKNPPPVPYFLPLDWRADEAFTLEIERAKSEYEHPEMKSFDLLKVFGVRPDPNAERWPGDLSVHGRVASA